MRKAMGVTNSQARAIENRYRQMNKNLDAIGKSSARALIAPLTGVGAALSAREVLRYADAWTSAKNSLAVAGVVGDRQVAVLERLFQSAQANAAPITALSDLFGKAAQASDNLGASQEELLKFSDGVAVALRVAGTSASQASGALTQLGQLLGQARVQAEEFNSVNEGARPILIAVANGLDAAGGSVSKLKSLVTDGKVSGQAFFQAFLRGLPTIQSMAANATQTIDQGLTKVNNALTRYIGQTDESLSASQRLVAGLNALADNFGETADVVLQLAAVIAGALVGRSIAGMIAKLVVGGAALGRFTQALRGAVTMASLASAFTGVGAAAGPVGLLIGGAVVGALALFASSSGEASRAAKLYANALAEVEAAANKATPAVADAAAAIDEKTRNDLTATLALAATEAEAAQRQIAELFDSLFRNVDLSIISPAQLKQLEDLRDGLHQGSTSAKEAENRIFALANSDPNFQAIADALSPLLDNLGKAIASADLLRSKLAKVGTTEIIEDRASRASADPSMDLIRQGQAFAKEAARRASLTKDQLALENEIAKVRKDADAAGALLTDKQIKAIAQANLAGDARRGGEGKKPKRERKDDYERETQQVIDYTVALVAETEATRQLNPLVNDYGYAAEKARIERELLTAAEKAGKEVTPQLRQEIAHLADQYATAQAEAAKLAETQEKQREQFEFYRESVKSAASGIASALSDGKLEWEELGDVAISTLDRIIDKMLNDLIDAIFDVIAASKSGGGSGILGMVANLLGGGISRFPSAPAGGGTASGIGLYDTGGYTGDGPRKKPAGIVHAGEMVFNQDDVRRFGGPGALDSLRRNGLPALPSLRGLGGGGGNVNMNLSVTVQGNGDQELMARMRAGAQEVVGAALGKFVKSKEFPRALGQALPLVRLHGFGG